VARHIPGGRRDIGVSQIELVLAADNRRVRLGAARRERIGVGEEQTAA